MVDIHRLRILCSVVATGSLKATADALSFTPSAVSQHLSALQRETGLTLFERSGRGVVPTAHGRRLAEKGEEALAAVTRVDQFIDDLRIGHTGSLTIGTFASAGEHWLPPVAAQLRREFPTTTLVIELTDPFVVILPRDHPYAGLREVAAADLGNDPWIHEFVGDGEAARIVEDIWRAAGIAPRSIIQAADHHGTIAFVAAGVGVSAMPALAATALPDSVVALPIVRPDAERIIVAHVRDSIRQQAAAERLLALLRDLGAAHHTPEP